MHGLLKSARISWPGSHWGRRLEGTERAFVRCHVCRYLDTYSALRVPTTATQLQLSDGRRHTRFCFCFLYFPCPHDYPGGDWERHGSDKSLEIGLYAQFPCSWGDCPRHLPLLSARQTVPPSHTCSDDFLQCKSGRISSRTSELLARRRNTRAGDGMTYFRSTPLCYVAEVGNSPSATCRLQAPWSVPLYG